MIQYLNYQVKWYSRSPKLRLLLILIVLVCNPAETFEANYDWCPTASCPALTSGGDDLCQNKWAFLLNVGKPIGGKPVDAMGRLDNLVEMKNNHIAVQKMILFLEAVQEGQYMVDENGDREGPSGHHLRNMNDIYYTAQRLMIETLSYSANNPSVIFGSLNDITESFFEHFSTTAFLHQLKNAFPCSRVINMVDQNHNLDLRKHHPLMTSVLFYEGEMSLGKVNTIMKLLSIEGCKFNWDGKLEGDCINSLAKKKKAKKKERRRAIG